jgi:hypothetical protein
VFPQDLVVGVIIYGECLGPCLSLTVWRWIQHVQRQLESIVDHARQEHLEKG